MSNFLKTGFLKTEDIKENFPSVERIKKKPVAIIECPQEIPCNPCVTSCTVHAVSMKTINSIPDIDFNKCIGCGNCIKICPGLAIFLINIKDGNGVVSLPYEMLPTPKKGEKVNLLNRKGEKIGKGTVTKIILPEKDTSAAIITVQFNDPELVYEVRNIEVQNEG